MTGQDGSQGEIPAAYRKPDYAEIAQMETELGLSHSAPAARVLLTRDMILKASHLRTEEVAVPEWGGSVVVRELSGRERDEWEASLATQRGSKMIPDVRNVRAKLVARSVVGEDGKPVFAPEDVDVLGELSAAALDRVFEVASRLSGLSEADLEAASGNSGTGQDAGFSSS